MTYRDSNFARARELIRDLAPTLRSSDRAHYDVQIPATRVLAHCALACDGDPVRDEMVDEVIGPSLDIARDLARAALDCIAIAEPSGARSSEEALSAIRWKLAQALRPAVEARTSDALGDSDPLYEQFADEPYDRRAA